MAVFSFQGGLVLEFSIANELDRHQARSLAEHLIIQIPNLQEQLDDVLAGASENKSEVKDLIMQEALHWSSKNESEKP